MGVTPVLEAHPSPHRAPHRAPTPPPELLLTLRDPGCQDGTRYRGYREGYGSPGGCTREVFTPREGKVRPVVG